MVYAVADAESSLGVGVVSKNYAHGRHGHHRIDKHGNPIVKSTDYGLMQINSALINKEEVKDAQGHAFKIGEDVNGMPQDGADRNFLEKYRRW